MVELRTRLLSAVVLGLALSLSVSSASAGLITLAQSSIDLLGPDPEPIGTLQTTITNGGNLYCNVLSQAFTDGAGGYIYLYQVLNTGTSANSPVELFTLWPFTGANDQSGMGWLTGALPAGFQDTPSQEPKARAYFLPPPRGPQISFYYSLDDGKNIDPGDHSVVMYVKSQLGPTQISGNVIDGYVATGNVIGPVPEPATLAFLVLGGVGLLLRRGRK